MRILWLSATNGLFTSSNSPCYNGGGWISSLQKLVETCNDLQLGFAFLSTDSSQRVTQGKTIYYPLYNPPLSKKDKIIKYYLGYKHQDNEHYLPQIQDVITDFKPDIIHLFGLENPLSIILGKTSIPVIVHIQGLLLPYDNAFYPPNINRHSFLWPPSLREWILRNGFIYAKKHMHARALNEHKLFLSAKYFMGRTIWDRQMSILLSGGASYFHVDEVLRDTFYEKSGSWKPTKGKFTISSTISETVYKGLDVVLKTANLLKGLVSFDFEWHIIGISPSSRLVRFYERATQIKSNEVNVIYDGIQNELGVSTILLQSDVYIHPSYIDNSPNSLCEAQMLGVPVIGSYVGGIPSLITDQISGILSPANAPYELAYHIKNLHNNSDLATKLSKGGTAEAQRRHDRTAIVNSLIETYKSVIHGVDLQNN